MATCSGGEDETALSEEEETAEEEIQSSVKSTAVVQYTAIPDDLQVRFRWIDLNTNLNRPPANWLRCNSKGGRLANIWDVQKPSFTSINIADKFMDCVDEVDIISDGKNVKKLLKMPFSRGQVSMVIHRIGSSLFLDEFDVYSELLRAEKENWKWLKDFYVENLVNDKLFARKRRTADILQSKNLLSKFISYSVADSSDSEGESSGIGTYHPDTLSSSLTQSAELVSKVPLSFQIPDTKPQQPNFKRTVLWSFEDIHMLVGTDLPIFGGGNYPAVSLRLCDTSKPINVLTGMDYWLDNLMCNVPEVALCYHLDGIVQNYECIKTENIPQLENSKFAPEVVKDIAQNILSFFNSNCTKEGHTYWLFKGHGDDIVKLYDLTSLCEQQGINKDENSFTLPVALLLCKVAKRMLIDTKERNQRDLAVIHSLLTNCLELVDRKLYPEIYASAVCMLAEIYVPETSDTSSTPPRTGASVSSDKQSNTFTDDNTDDADENYFDVGSVGIENLCKPCYKKQVYKPPPMNENMKERCLKCLQHISEALQCIEFASVKSLPGVNVDETPVQTKTETVGEPPPCEDMTPTQSNTTPLNTAEPSSALIKWSPPALSWYKRDKLMLFRKATLAFKFLAETVMKPNSINEALHYVHNALLCIGASKTVSPETSADNVCLLSSIIQQCGDAQLIIAQNHDSYNSSEPITSQITGHVTIANYAKQELKNTETYEWFTESKHSMENCLTTSLSCYEEALNILPESDSTKDQWCLIIRRLGNVWNELGKFYMNKTMKTSKETDAQLADSYGLKSCRAFESGMKFFEMVDDLMNVALLLSNTGRLMRVCAQTYANRISTREFTHTERLHYTRAIEYYEKALSKLKDECVNENLRDAVKWELSSTYFTVATLLQDRAPLLTHPQEEVERDIINAMNKSLKHCQNLSAAKDDIVQYRNAVIHHRMASLHHNSYRNQIIETRSKQLRSLAETHYMSAVSHYVKVDQHCDVLRVHLERVALYEHQFKGQTSVQSKLKTLHVILTILLDLLPTLVLLRTSLGSDLSSSSHQSCVLDTEHCPSVEPPTQSPTPTSESENNPSVSTDELRNVLTILVSRIQFSLLNIIKLMSAKKRSPDHSRVSVYKDIYGASLKLDITDKYELLCRITDYMEDVSSKLKTTEDDR